MSRIIAFDLGGTRLKAGNVDPTSGVTSEVISHPVGPDVATALETLGSVGDQLSSGSAPGGIGLCVPGLVDEKGVVVALPGKLAGIEGFDLPGFVEGRLGQRPLVVNDAIAYGAGEAVFGAGREASRVVVMTIGTGVGVCAYQDGRPLGTGPLGGGILGGQIPIGQDGDYTDTSGRTDTIEARCRADRIADLANEQGARYSGPAEVLLGERQGDGAAINGLARYRKNLETAVTALAHAHAPDVVVVGGGPLSETDQLLRGVEEGVNRRLFGNYRIRVRRAELGDAAALAGLAGLIAKS